MPLYCRLIAVLLLCTPALAQDDRPRLELEPRFNLNGGGFQAVSGSMSAGFGFEREHYNFHFDGTYNTARKADYVDPTTNLTVYNPHGNIESVGGSIYGRTTGGYLLGCTGGYSRLRTTLFNKDGYGMGCGGGRDFYHVTCPMCNDYGSFRLTAEFGLVPLPGKPDQENGVTFHFTVPSPTTGGHVFFDERSFVGWISTGGHLHHDATTNIGFLFRF